jgi:two-component system cell cycle sensor histidine kinase PleC
MSQLTPELISRGRGADPAEAAARRRVSKQMRAVREKLTSSTGLGRVFDYELLRLFAQSRTNATTAMLVLAMAVALTSCQWLNPVAVTVWALVMASAICAQLILCQRFLKLTMEQISTRTWHFQFVAAEAIQGCSWLVIVNLLLNTHEASARTFVMFVMLLVAAVTSMLAASIPAAAYAGLVPLSLAIFSISELAQDIEKLTMPLMVGAGLFYFLLLANRLYSTSVATLEFRAEKDSLIAELEQAKANSDEARRRAEESNLAKSRFLATMSHELRTPLNAILGFSEVMKGELFGAHQIPAYREYAEDIHVSGQLLLNIINEILDLSRIEAGRYELKEEAVNFSHVTEDCIHLLQMRAKARAITLKHDVQPGLPRVWADERASRQIVLNLLSNAIKFTPPGGEVVVSLKAMPDGGQALAVSDNGPGIPEEEIPTVLLSFGRGSLAIKTAEQGSGLGLPIVKGLVDLHGGRFELTSKPRQGTNATVIFPPQRVMNVLPPVNPNDPDPRRRPSLRRKAA